jgi:hypothetical protein
MREMLIKEKKIQNACLISDNVVTHIEYFSQLNPFRFKNSDLIIKNNYNTIAILNNIV